jgi:hypothetical protein
MIMRELFMCSVVAISLSVAAQDPVSSMIEPTCAATVIGQSQAFLLLGRDGQEISASNWTASGPDLADLQVDGAHAILTPQAKGRVALGSSDGVQGRDRRGRPQRSRGLAPDSCQMDVTADRWRIHVRALGEAWGGSRTDADPITENDPASVFL